MAGLQFLGLFVFEAISGATGSGYTLVGSDAGHTVRVQVTATNSGGSNSATSAQTGVVQVLAPVNSLLPVVSGSAVEGQALKASNGSWSGSPTSYAYQWQDGNSSGSSCSAISGATGSGYTLVGSDAGHTAQGAGHCHEQRRFWNSATSAQTGVVQVLAPVNSLLPVVSGSAVEGQALKASNGTWSGSPTSYAYQWQDCTSSGSSCASISGATGSSYTLVGSDAGHTVRVQVTATNSGGSTAAGSAQTAVVAAKPSAPANTGLPTVGRESAVEGEMLKTYNGYVVG